MAGLRELRGVSHLTQTLPPAAAGPSCLASGRERGHVSVSGRDRKRVSREVRKGGAVVVTRRSATASYASLLHRISNEPCMCSISAE